MKIQDFFRNRIIVPISQSIRLKVSILVFFVALVPLIVATVITVINSKEAMEQKIIKENTALIEWVRDDFTSDINGLSKVMTAFFYDPDMLFYNAKVFEGSPWQNEAVQFLRTKLQSHLLANLTDIETIYYYSTICNRLFSTNYEEGFTINFASNNAIKNIIANEKDNELYYLSEDDNSLNISGPYLTRYLKRFENKEIIGILKIEIKSDIFQRAKDLLLSEEGSAVIFIDLDGKLLYSSDSQFTEEQGKEWAKKINKYHEQDYYVQEDVYVFFKKISDNIYLIKSIPTCVATDFYKEILISQLLLIFITGLTTLGIVIFFGAKLTKPLSALAHSMQKISSVIEKDVETIKITKSKDEIWILEQSYNSMINQIKELIDKEYRQQIEIQNAHLMALQAQINPHFMYNTLQMIGSIAVEKKLLVIYDIVSAFAKMMRYNMQLTEELVTIEQELDNMNQYLQIQHKRFDNKLIVEQIYNDDIKEYLIPKLSLQPIVENCFKYGFLKSKDCWNIKIEILKHNEDLVVVIEDNGKGISENELGEIRNKLLKHRKQTIFDTEKIGLKNIDSRIKLHFSGSNKYGLRINSELHKYTKIIMVIKAVTKKDVTEC